MTPTKEQTLSDRHNYDRIRYLFGAAVVCPPIDVGLSSRLIEAGPTCSCDYKNR